MVYLAYAMTIPSVGYLITIYFYWQTVKKMDTQSQGVNVSDKVKRLQQQFNRVLIIQVRVFACLYYYYEVLGCNSVVYNCYSMLDCLWKHTAFY